MNSRVPPLILCMVLGLLIMFQPVVNAQTTSSVSGISASLSKDYASVSIDLRLSQNFSSLVPFAFPEYTGLLQGQNASAASTALESALQRRSPEAHISGLILSLDSSAVASGTYLQSFNVSLRFQVKGIQSYQNNAERIDLAWKSFEAPSNITVGGVEVNRIGTVYMVPLATQVASTTGNTTGFRYEVDQRLTSYVFLARLVPRIQLLNFSRLMPAVSTWHEAYDFASRAATWSMSAGPGLGFLVTETVTEPREVATLHIGLFYTLQATISGPAKSIAQNDTVVAVFGDSVETTMAVIIGSTVVVGSASFFYESRVLKKGTRRKLKQ